MRPKRGASSLSVCAYAAYRRNAIKSMWSLGFFLLQFIRKNFRSISTWSKLIANTHINQCVTFTNKNCTTWSPSLTELCDNIYIRKIPKKNWFFIFSRAVCNTVAAEVFDKQHEWIEWMDSIVKIIGYYCVYGAWARPKCCYKIAKW